MLDRQVLHSNDVYEIFGVNGWEDFKGILVSEGIFYIVHIITENNKWIKCTKNHPLFDTNDKKILAGNLKVGDYIQTIEGTSKISSINSFETNKVYDIWNSESHKFYTNGIKSGNCDEFAFLPPNLAEAFWVANYPALSASKESKVAIISTPNGMFNLFHTLYEGARTPEEIKEYNKIIKTKNKELIDNYNNANNNKNRFVKAKFTWRDVPGRDQAWAETERANIKDIRFNQEFECVAGSTKIYTIKSIEIQNVFEELKSHSKESENITFVNNTKRLQILTPWGLKPFKGIRKISATDEETKHKKCLKFYIKGPTSEIIEIITSEHHVFMLGDMRKKASELVLGETLQHKKYGIVKVIKIEETERCDLYDIVGIKDVSRYFTNDIVSHNCDFLGSTATLINPRSLERLLKENIQQPKLVDLAGRLRVYEDPIEGATYVIGVDPAKGTGKHDSCAQVLKIESLNPFKADQVAVFQSNKTDAYEFSKILQRLGLFYNHAHLIIENNAEGSSLVHNLWWLLEYEHLYCENRTKTGMGIRASAKTKTKSVLLMKRFLEEKNLFLRDEPTIVQLATYIEDDNGKYGGQQGQPDDLVSALHWAAYSPELNIFDEDVEIIKKGIDDEEGWGILTDVEEQDSYLNYQYPNMFN